MSALVYEVTNMKTDLEKGYSDLELYSINCDKLKPIDATMLIMPKEKRGAQPFHQILQDSSFCAACGCTLCYSFDLFCGFGYFWV